jgi:hypothetical protein
MLVNVLDHRAVEFSFAERGDESKCEPNCKKCSTLSQDASVKIFSLREHVNGALTLSLLKNLAKRTGSKCKAIYAQLRMA